MNVRDKTKCILSTVDKDLNNTPGWHHNMRTGEVYWVTEEEATYSFYKQLLTGDRTDNIQGIKGVGDVKATKILAECDSELSMYLAVNEAYINYVESTRTPLDKECIIEEAHEMLLENSYLLWMVRELDDSGAPIMWRPPE